jgi:hypothetical protein
MTVMAFMRKNRMLFGNILKLQHIIQFDMTININGVLDKVISIKYTIGN